MVSPRSGTFRLVVFASVNVLKPGSWLIVIAAINGIANPSASVEYHHRLGFPKIC